MLATMPMVTALAVETYPAAGVTAASPAMDPVNRPTNFGFFSNVQATMSHVIAAKEAATPEFKSYAHAIVANAKVLAEGLLSKGFSLVTGGTDNHLILIDLRSKNVSGKVAAQALDRAGIVGNYNSIPFDPRKPLDPSGIRIGTPALTTRGMGVDEMRRIGAWMLEALRSPDDAAVTRRIRGEVSTMCKSFPVPAAGMDA